MSTSLFQVLPILVIGFLFNRHCFYFRYKVALAEGQRLFFVSAASGLCFALLAFLVRPMVPPVCWVATFLNDLPGQYSDISLLAALLAVFFVSVLNLSVVVTRSLIKVGGWQGSSRPDARTPHYSLGLKSAKEWIKSAEEQMYAETVETHGNLLQRLVLKAFTGREQVLLNLKSRKVYCGFIDRIPALSLDWRHQYIAIIPVFSAARDKDDLSLKNRLDYRAFEQWELYKRIELIATAHGKAEPVKRKLLGHFISEDDLKENKLEELLERLDRRLDRHASKIDIRDWVKVIPIAEIESASLYDSSAPDHWFLNPKPVAPVLIRSMAGHRFEPGLS